MNPNHAWCGLLIVGWLAGCSTTDSPDQGAGQDAGMNDPDAGRTQDLGAPDMGTGPLDTGVAYDAGPGSGSLDGTSLEGLSVQWSGDIAVCNAWRENDSLEQEIAAKVRLELKESPRVSLDQAHLQSAFLSGGRTMRSPVSGGQEVVDMAVVQTTLRDYEVRDPAGNSSLSAVLEHRLASGAIIEEYLSVYRQRGDTSPVVYGTGYEVAFGYRAPGASSLEGIYMEPCGGAEELESAVEVLVGRNNEHAITVTRYFDTLATFAGSYPVQLKAHAVKLSDRPWDTEWVRGFWAHTYSAQHHNWFENTRLDFRGDLGRYETIFEPFDRGDMLGINETIARIDLKELAAWDVTPTIEMEILDLQTGNTRLETFSTDGRWRLVDTRRTTEAERFSCPGAQVVTLSTEELSYGFHLVNCGDEFNVSKLIPISFLHEPEQIGQAVEGAALQEVVIDGRPGIRAQVGNSQVEISKGTEEYYFVTVLDESSQPVMKSLMYEHALADPRSVDEVHAFEGQGVRLEFTRRWVSLGVGESYIYAPRRFSLSFDGVAEEVLAWDRMVYTNSHHNWADRFEAVQGGLRMTWETQFLPQERHTIQVIRESDGVEVLPQTEVSKL